MKKEIREKICQAMDSFLAESKDQSGNERSLKRLNNDRQLFVKKIKEIFDEETDRVINIAIDETIEQLYRENITMENLVKIIKAKL